MLLGDLFLDMDLVASVIQLQAELLGQLLQLIIVVLEVEALAFIMEYLLF